MSDLLVNWFGPLANHKQLMFMGMWYRQKGSDFSAGARQIETAKGRGRLGAVDAEARSPGPEAVGDR